MQPNRFGAAPFMNCTSSREGNLVRPLAEDIRRGFVSVEDAAVLLDQLADLGDICFSEWMK
jgi:hypothetical protein